MRVATESGSRWKTLVTSRARRTALALALPFAAVVFTSSLSHADDVSAQDIAQARQLGQQAQVAYEAGNYAESEKLWAAAAQLYAQAPTLILGLARTQAKQGKMVVAQESYNKILREWSATATLPPAFKDAVEAAKAEVAVVSAKVASVVVTVTGPESARVAIDGQTVPSAALGLRRPVDPGTHVVKATADGWKPAEVSFTVNEGGSAEAKVVMERPRVATAAPAPAPVPAAARPQEPVRAAEPSADVSPKSGSSRKTLALVAFGIGGAGLVVGAATGLVALGKHSDLESKCPSGTCPSDVRSDVDSYQTMGTISTAGFIVGGVGAVAGVVLLLTAPKSNAHAATGSVDPMKHARAATDAVSPSDHGGAARTAAFDISPFFGGTSAGLRGTF